MSLFWPSSFQLREKRHLDPPVSHDATGDDSQPGCGTKPSLTVEVSLHWGYVLRSQLVISAESRGLIFLAKIASSKLGIDSDIYKIAMFVVYWMELTLGGMHSAMVKLVISPGAFGCF